MRIDYSEENDFKEHKQHILEMDDALESIVISKNSRVLDVGGGQGMHVCFLAQRYTSCFCMDVIDYQSLYGGEFYKLYKEKCERNLVDFDNKNIKFIESNAMDMLFRDNYFDFVTSFNALEHITDPSKALDEIIRVTNRGGIIYITFDPIWTADTGSHFIHRVNEPWAHLVYEQEEFIDKMRISGSSEDEITDYKYGMNQVRLSQYRQIFKTVVTRNDIDLLHESSWSGLADSSYDNHVNYKKCINSGYSAEELRCRGMRYILKKM